MSFDPDAPAEGDGLFGLPSTVDDAALVVVPVPFEATASYRRGTSGGPEAILQASKQVDLHDVETGEPWERGIAMEPVDPRLPTWNAEASANALDVIAAGGAHTPALLAKAARVDEIMEKLNHLVHQRVSALYARGKVPAVVGGDHSVPFGAIKAASEHFPGIGVLHVDAHADLRVAYEGFTWSHASILYNVRTRLPGVGHIAQVGIRDVSRSERDFSASRADMSTWYHPDVAWAMAGGEPWQRIVHTMIAPLPKNVWVTFDIDGLDPALCPHTGTPVPGGLTWNEALVLLRALGTSGRRIVGFDVNEVTPCETDEWDAIVGARLVYKLAGWALASQR